MSEAHAFLRTILKNPDDSAAPLVFADWLEESGERDKLIWARYIRACDALDRLDEADPERERKRVVVDLFGQRVRYRIRMHASSFAPHVARLIRFLPSIQWTVDLRGFESDPATIAMVPETACRAYRLIPLLWLGDHLLVAIEDVKNCEILWELLNVIGPRVLYVAADSDQVQAAIDRHYPVNQRHEFLCGG